MVFEALRAELLVREGIFDGFDPLKRGFVAFEGLEMLRVESVASEELIQAGPVGLREDEVTDSDCPIGKLFGAVERRQGEGASGDEQIC